LWNVSRVGWEGDTDVSENQTPPILAAEQDPGRYKPGYSATATVLLKAKKKRALYKGPRKSKVLISVVFLSSYIKLFVQLRQVDQ